MPVVLAAEAVPGICYRYLGATDTSWWITAYPESRDEVLARWENHRRTVKNLGSVLDLDSRSYFWYRIAKSDPTKIPFLSWGRVATGGHAKGYRDISAIVFVEARKELEQVDGPDDTQRKQRPCRDTTTSATTQALETAPSATARESTPLTPTSAATLGPAGTPKSSSRAPGETKSAGTLTLSLDALLMGATEPCDSPPSAGEAG